MRNSIVGLAAAATLAVVSAGCASDATTAPVPAPDPVVSAGPTAAAPAGTERALPVYYLADTPAGPRLYREFHRVATADPATDALREMLAASSGRDRDYRSHWPPSTTLRGPVAHAGGVITVDLSGVGPGPRDGDLAPLMIQQLVFTVQAALQSTDPVRILVDAAPVDELWNVDTSDPVPRGDAFQLRSLVQIDDPSDGATVGRDVVVSGEAAVFEATLLWQVLRGDEVVRSGIATTAEGQTFAPYTFTVRLDPGEYVVRVSEDDPSDGEGRPPLTDDKTVTVS